MYWVIWKFIVRIDISDECMFYAYSDLACHNHKTLRWSVSSPAKVVKANNTTVTGDDCINGSFVKSKKDIIVSLRVSLRVYCMVLKLNDWSSQGCNWTLLQLEYHGHFMTILNWMSNDVQRCKYITLLLLNWSNVAMGLVNQQVFILIWNVVWVKCIEWFWKLLS